MRQGPHTPPRRDGDLPLGFVRQFVLTDKDLAGTKTSEDTGKPYVCVVIFNGDIQRRWQERK